MLNKRSLNRRHLLYYLKVYDQHSDIFIGNMVDITTEGILLTCDAEIKIHTCFDFRIILPEEFPDADEILCRVQSKWQRQLNSEVYDIGFNFIKISTKDTSNINRLIDEFAFQH